MTRRPLALLALLIAGPGLADEPKLPDVATFDKLVVDSLRDVHNKGADLYNLSKDPVGAYRMFQGALFTVQPLLAHRPEAQKLIADGLAAADKEREVVWKAFKLHEAIEAVRTHLKATEPKKVEEPQPKSNTEVAPPPREKKQR